uniref:Uncharacterized protein n=1 Tax=Picea sitchensis TaxID=3332 RepID=A9NLZ6_PICSI|nr:unknown [Picea sitchensis]
MAAMLGLIAIALLILACSYWKLSGQVGQSNSGGLDNNAASVECSEDTEEKVIVIMAGEERPTFLAKPAMSRTET